MTTIDRPRLVAKFIDKPVLREDGRLVYALLTAFALKGYRITLIENRDFRQIGPLGPMIYNIEGLEPAATIHGNTAEMLYLFDVEDGFLSRQRWKKKIHLKFDVFSNYAWASYRGNEPVLLPYPMHPWNYGGDLARRLEAARRNEKKVRVFFSGDTNGYKRNRILYPRPKLTRVQVIDAILNHRSPDLLLIEDKATLDDALNGGYKKRCAIVDMSKVFVEDWLNNLSKADFFLCPPGYVMPMCHNTVEAMAVGTVPIINYPEWFRPSLRHMETCIAFNDESDLIAKINDVLGMDSEAIARMRRNVIDYYERHLDPTVFVKEIEARDRANVTVLMITDLCTVNDAPKLNRNSFLIRDNPIDRSAGLRGLLSAMLRDRRDLPEA